MRLACGLVIIMAACGGGGGGGDDQPDGSTGATCQPGTPFDLTGRAGVLADLNVHVNAGGVVETDTTSQLLVLLDLTQTGTDLTVTAKLCDIDIPDVTLSGQEMPVHFEPGPGLIESVAAVDSAGSLSGTTSCSTFTSQPITLVIGARMDPPDQGTLPEADSGGVFAECAPAGSTCDLAIGSQCACDQEADAKPGATLLAMNTPAVDLDEVYVDIRTTFSMTGDVWSSDQVQGEITASLEQGILDCHKANNTDCTNGEVGAIKAINPVITQQPGNPSTFRTARVDASVGCAELIAMKDQLFPR